MEIWKDAPGLESHFKVSNKGRCMRKAHFARTIEGSWYFADDEEVACNSGEYARVACEDNGKTRSAAIHRLVALAFIPNPENKPVVNHIYGNKRNNAVDNLEWATYAENSQHAYRTGLNSGEKIIEGKRRRALERLAEKEEAEKAKKVEEVEEVEYPGKIERKVYVPHHGWTRVVSYEV